jgi:hypothetical protein
MNYWPQADKTHSDSPVTVTVDDRAFWCDTSSGAIVFNLPSVIGKAALYFVFKKMTSDTNTVTINAPAGKNIDGASSYILTNLNQIIGIVADTSGNFKLVDGNSSGAAVGTGRVAIEKTDGNFAVGNTLTAPSGMTYSLDMQTNGTVVITVSAAFAYSFQAFENAYIGVEVDGTQYSWPVLDGTIGAGSDTVNAVGGSHTIGVQLTSGTHTIKALVSGHQHTGSITVYANASNPLSLVIQYPTVVNFGGGSPTSDPTNDLAGTWDTVQVVGLQDATLPAPVAGGYLRRNLMNTGWEDVTWLNDITNQIKLDQWAVPDDVTRLNVSTTRHGLTPKLPLVGGSPDVTNFLRADGTWSTPAGSGSSSAGDPLGKLFFSNNSLLPNNTYFEKLYDYPTTDFANLNGGTKSVSMSRARFTPGGANVANWGWDLGGAKTKVLFIVGQVRGWQNQIGLFMSGSSQAVPQIESSYDFDLEPGVPDIAILKRSGGAWTGLATETKIVPTNSAAGMSFGMAFYYDDSTNRLIGFIRLAGEWIPVIDITDTTFTTMRYVGIFNDSAAGTGSVSWTSCPMALYYE